MDFLSLVAKLSLDASEYEGGLNKAKNLATTLGNGVKTGLKVAGAAVGAATAAVGAFGLSAVKVGASFDSSMSQVAATLGYTSDDIANNINGAGDAFNALREKAEEAGRSTIFSASESAEGLNILAMSGYNAEESIEMLDDVLHLAAAGSMDMASAAGYVSGAMKGFNDDTKDSAYYADLMAKGATLANTNVQQLGEAMSSGAAGAAAYNQSADSMTVALLRLAEQGEVGAAAGTALAAAMKNLYTPTDQAKAALEELGVDAFDSTTGAARDFNEVVNELNNALSGYTDEQKSAYKQTIFGIQGLDAFNKMTVTGVEKQEEWADALANSAGEASKQYATMTNNLEGDVAGWNSALEGFKIAISEGAMPSIREFVQFGTEGLSRVTSAFKSDGLSGAMSEFGNVLSEGVAMVTGAIPDMVTAGVELLKAFGKGIVDNAPEIINAVINVGAQLLDAATGLMENLTVSMQEVDFGEVATGIIDKIVQSFETGSLGKFANAALTMIWEFIQGFYDAAPQILSSAGDIVNNIANAITSKAPEIIPAAVQMISNLTQAITDPTNVTKFLQAAVTLVMGLAQGLINAVPILLRDIPIIIANIIGALVAAIPQLLSLGAQLIVALAGGLISAIPDIVAAIPAIILALVGGLAQGVVAIAETGRQLIAGFVLGIKNAWNGAVNTIVTFFTGFITRVKALFGVHSPSTVFSDIGKNLIQGLINGIQNMMSGLKRKAEDIVNAFKELPKKVVDVGKNIIEGIWKGMSNATDWIKGQITSWVGNVVDFMKGLFGIHSPSTVMRDEVGKFLGLGVAEGITDTIPDVKNAMSDLTDITSTDFSANVAASGITRGSENGIIDYDNLAKAIVKAFVDADIDVEVDGRTFGRLVRKAVAY